MKPWKICPMRHTYEERCKDLPFYGHLRLEDPASGSESWQGNVRYPSSDVCAVDETLC